MASAESPLDRPPPPHRPRPHWHHSHRPHSTSAISGMTATTTTRVARRRDDRYDDDDDDAVRSTADDAALAKLSCVERGYYDDPYLRPMSVGAGGLVRGGGRGGNMKSGGGDDEDEDDDEGDDGRRRRNMPRHDHRHHHRHHRARCGANDQSGTEPMIRRGTHARVMAMERAIDAFLSLDAPPPQPSSSSSSSSPSHSSSSKGEEEGGGGCGRGCIRRRRQIVILGAGRDTTYLRYRFGGKKRGGDDDGHGRDGVRWFEVDHPSTIEQKARIWLPRCVPDGHDYECLATNREGDDDASYTIVIAPRTKQGVDDDEAEGGRNNGPDYRRVKGDDDASSLSSTLSSSSYSSDYHLVGHDLRSSPDALFRKLVHHGYDEKSSSSSTLFVLECVLMYMPETSARDLLRRIAAGPTSSTSTSSSFVAVAIYDPIPGHDRFGQLMIENLKRAGVAGGDGGGGGRRRGGDDERESDNARLLPSLEVTRTLADQLARVRTCGFDVAVGCTMVDAYEHGVMRDGDRRRAMRCEVLDELEEFYLLMRHYCLLVGVASSLSRGVGCIDVGDDDDDGDRLMKRSIR
ncbi:hypothetical protein ACHAW5_006115 [Stephanodiscus triporus]|uniref:[phosphatase 2A protein]-leucine-carboxy methyltransferase n=1 Tax=Stephanodiscus triporus TaxID=2934178 RepID=A0ABD3NTH4_9STRA